MLAFLIATGIFGVVAWYVLTRLDKSNVDAATLAKAESAEKIEDEEV